MDEQNKNVENSENKDKIEIVSADLLNPFQTTRQDTIHKPDNVVKKEEGRNEIKEEVKVPNVVQEKVVVQNNSYVNSNNNTSSNDEDDFYSNLSGSSPRPINDYIQKYSTADSTKTNDLNDARPIRKSSAVFLILAFVGFGIQFLNGYFVFIGLGLCIISFIGSIIMYRKVAKYALLSMIVSFLLSAVSIFLNIVAYKTVNNFVDRLNESVFRDVAKSYVNAAEMNGAVNRSISCNGDNNSIRYSLPELSEFYQNDSFKLDNENSYILVEAVTENDECIFKEYIYLIGEHYSIGTPDNPVAKNDIDTAYLNEK